ncbi:MAG TPA: hypothetical protein VE010_08010 [Thermoanaerobaculia bacterium]|nr:hypothetical protein [Thermoanaerobaculia bacterium]
MAAPILLSTLDLALPGATYAGPMLDDIDTAEATPMDVWATVVDVNGFIAFGGALHVRGICFEPSWHSLGAAWTGERALHRLFPAIQPEDVPFAQDALGNQFVLREERVWFMEGETGELHSLGFDIQDWLAALIASPGNFLPLHVLEQFRAGGDELRPGYLLSAYPPFCAKESADGVSLRAIPIDERLGFLAALAAQLTTLPDGSRVRIATLGG